MQLRNVPPTYFLLLPYARFPKDVLKTSRGPLPKSSAPRVKRRRSILYMYPYYVGLIIIVLNITFICITYVWSLLYWISYCVEYYIYMYPYHMYDMYMYPYDMRQNTIALNILHIWLSHVTAGSHIRCSTISDCIIVQAVRSGFVQRWLWRRNYSMRQFRDVCDLEENLEIQYNCIIYAERYVRWMCVYAHEERCRIMT